MAEADRLDRLEARLLAHRRLTCSATSKPGRRAEGDARVVRIDLRPEPVAPAFNVSSLMTGTKPGLTAERLLPAGIRAAWCLIAAAPSA